MNDRSRPLSFEGTGKKKDALRTAPRASFLFGGFTCGGIRGLVDFN